MSPAAGDEALPDSTSRVETVLRAHPAVADCSVVRPTAPGEPLEIVVALATGHKIAADELARHLRLHDPAAAPGPLRFRFRSHRTSRVRRGSARPSPGVS